MRSTGMMVAVARECTKCKTLKEDCDFSPDRRRKSGLQARCKQCSSFANKLRYEENPEVRLAKKLYDAEYVKANREKKYKNNDRWNEKNKDRIKERNKAWKKANRHKVTSHTRKRQAAKLNRTPPWLTEDQLKEIENFYWMARDLKAVSGQTYHVDHIVPLQGKNISGLHVPWNLQVLPSDINERKSNKHE